MNWVLPQFTKDSQYPQNSFKTTAQIGPEVDELQATVKSNELNYHGVQIGKAINQSRGFGEALLKGVAEIVSGVGGDNENRGSNPR